MKVNNISNVSFQHLTKRAFLYATNPYACELEEMENYFRKWGINGLNYPDEVIKREAKEWVEPKKGEDYDVMLRLVESEALNKRFHVDYQNGRYVVCEIKSENTRNKDDVTKGSVRNYYIPYKNGIYGCDDIKKTALMADVLEEKTEKLPKEEVLLSGSYLL